MKRIGFIGAAAIALLMFSNVATASADKPEEKKHHGKPEKGEQQQPAPQPAPPPQQQQAQQQQQAAQAQAQREQVQLQQAQQQAQQQHLREQQQARQQQVQQQQIAEQQQRTAQVQRNLEEQLRLAQAHNAQLEQQKRTTQYQIQQEYARSLEQQRVQVQNDRNYNYRADPYFSTSMNYRYTRDGRSYRTNRYGADVLRQAVNNGYQEGFRAGDADRRDHWRYNYQDAFAYRDANYGYVGRYVNQTDYNYYFRQGFRKGYEDGYYRRAKYGRQVNGRYTVLQVVLGGILKLQVIR
jgi:hypothetical protein